MVFEMDNPCSFRNYGNDGWWDNRGVVMVQTIGLVFEDYCTTIELRGMFIYLLIITIIIMNRRNTNEEKNRTPFP